MTVEWAGPILAVVTVATIGAGHVAVRKLNYHLGTWPAYPLFALGLGGLVASLFVSSDIASAALGIVGITTLWDGVEMFRQERRVNKGHAPRNPRRFGEDG